VTNQAITVLSEKVGVRSACGRRAPLLASPSQATIGATA